MKHLKKDGKLLGKVASFSCGIIALTVAACSTCVDAENKTLIEASVINNSSQEKLSTYKYFGNVHIENFDKKKKYIKFGRWSILFGDNENDMYIIDRDGYIIAQLYGDGSATLFHKSADAPLPSSIAVFYDGMNIVYSKNDTWFHDIGMNGLDLIATASEKSKATFFDGDVYVSQFLSNNLCDNLNIEDGVTIACCGEQGAYLFKSNEGLVKLKATTAKYSQDDLDTMCLQNFPPK